MGRGRSAPGLRFTSHGGCDKLNLAEVEPSVSRRQIPMRTRAKNSIRATLLSWLIVAVATTAGTTSQAIADDQADKRDAAEMELQLRRIMEDERNLAKD